MNLIFCVAKPEIYVTFKQHATVVKECIEMPPQQQSLFFHTFDEKELMWRACLFFGCNDIELKQHSLYFHHKLRDITYRVDIYTHWICIYDSLSNPFLPFFKRLYRNDFSWEKPCVEETSTKVL